MNNLHMSEILSSKYDVHLDYQITMYDQLPYKRNSDLCGEQHIAMYSGHVIKYYMCDNDNDDFEINNHDDEIKARLAEIEAHTVITPTVEDTSDELMEGPDGISQEQIKTLLDDKTPVANSSIPKPEDFAADDFSESFSDDFSAETTDDNDFNDSIPSVDAFAGIEDW